MGIFDKVKDTVKGVTDKVTGKGAKVTLEHDGVLTPGGAMNVKVTVESTGHAVKAEGVAIDLYGEDDLDESLFEKAREVVMREKGPKHLFKIGEPFTVEAGGTKVIEGSFTLPAELPEGLAWLIRARVEAFGNDPDTGWIRLE